jgi:hypothetical protein
VKLTTLLFFAAAAATAEPLVPPMASTAPPPAAVLPDSGPAEVVAALTAAWNARDVDAYLAQWEFASPEAKEVERAFAAERLDKNAGTSRLALYAPPVVAASVKRVVSYGEIVTINEPWGQVEQVMVRLVKQNGRWTVITRQSMDRLEGLAHLTLDPHGFAANGQVLHLPDFDMTLKSGTIFTTPDSLGRTALVFTGEGRVQFRPQPPNERDQLRRYAGKSELDETVRTAFVRLNPADFASVVTGPPLVVDPMAMTRWPAALRFYNDQVENVYLMDAPVAGSPWWIIPPHGDAVAIFDYGRGPLTFSINTNAAEGVNFFDRTRQRQICLYPLPGKARDFDDAGDRRFDLLHADVKVKIDPESDRVEGEAHLRMAALVGGGTVHLRLNDALVVDSVSSEDGRRHLAFRLRRQKTLVITTGGAVRGQELNLVVQYHGTLRPPPFEREPSGHEEPAEFEKALRITPPLVYAQPTAWYPQPESEDFATGMIEVDLPNDYNLAGPGRHTATASTPGRTLHRLVVEQPMKYFVIAVGQFAAAGERRESGVTLTALATPRLKGTAASSLDMATRIVRLFTEQFGPCPYHDIQLVLFEAAKPGGHSPPGLTLLAERPLVLGVLHSDDPANFADQPGFFLAHELAHQWWGDGVATASYHDRWISEAAAHYAAALWIRHSRGEDEFRNVMREMERWALDLNDAGAISLGYRVGHLDGDPKLYRAVVYDKGACVLNTLRRLLGDDAFRRGLTRFQERYRFAKAGTPQMRQSLEEAGGRDLTPYFEAWIYGTSVPVLSLSSHTQPAAEGGFRTALRVSAQELPGPVPIEIRLERESGHESRIETLTPEGGSWEFETVYEPRRLRVNQDAGLLARVREQP